VNESPKGQSIPPVDPEDLKRTWEYDQTHSRVNSNGWQWLQDRRAVCSSGANVDTVWYRGDMIETLARHNHGKLLAPWKHGDELDDAVFRIAAIFPTFPAQLLTECRYKMPGDYLYRFDLNAFIQRLIDETGISHTWEPVRIRLEGARCYSMGAGYSQDPETEAKRRARELLWMIWERFDCHGLIPLYASTEVPENVAGLFADFLIDNIDLFHEVEASFRTVGHPTTELLVEVEKRAERWDAWSS